MGKKKRPFYRIVAADSRRARDGRFLEVLGTYNPIERPATVVVAEEKITKWLDDGAVLSDTVDSLLRQIGYIEKYNKAKSGADVSEMVVKATISERKKKTRQMKKAALAEAETKKAAEAAKAAEAKAAEEAKVKAAKEAEEAAAKAAEEPKADEAAPEEEKSE